MKILVPSFLALLTASSVSLAQINPGEPTASGLTPRMTTFEVNPDLLNNETESYGLGIAGNGNVIIGWEDDSTTEDNINFFGAVHTMFNSAGTRLTPVVTVTNYDGSQSINTYHRAFYRPNGTPTPGNEAWGPKIKANLFGDGVGQGATAFALGFDIPALADINIDAGGGDDFPAVQLMDNGGSPTGYATYGDSDAEPTGGIRIGDWDYLSNGNIVIAGESRQDADLVNKFGGPANNRHVTYKIVTPNGTVVKTLSLGSASNVDRCEMWHGIGVTANGFALRFNVASGASTPGATVRLFDNAGNPITGNINLATLTGHPETGTGGRGDGSGFHGNTRDAYVQINSGGGTAWITVINDDGTLRYSRKVADAGNPDPVSDRVDAAISPDGRVIAVFDDNSEAGFRLPMARLFAANGDGVGGIFWVSERDRKTIATALAEQPRVAWRGGTVAIIWRTLNSQLTFDQVLSARFFDIAPVSVIGEPEESGLTPRTTTSEVNPDLLNNETESYGVGIARNGNVIIGWEDDSTTEDNINFFGAVHSMFDSTATRLTPVVTVTNYDGSQSINTYHRAFYRPNGTPTPGNEAWGPKIKANLFGDGVGQGATAFALGFDIPALADINIDAGGGDDFPAVQLMDNGGGPIGYATYGDSDAEPNGGIRIGDWDYLSNGNIVIAGESRQDADLVTKFGGPANNRHVTYKIVTPNGTVVKALSLGSASNVDRCEMWHGVGVTANGFALRFNVASGASTPGATVRLFDNAGNPITGNINLATLTGHPETGTGGRGDGSGFHGNGTDAYVQINSGGGNPWITVLNDDGTLRYSRKAGEDFETIGSDRVDAAISPDGRVLAVFDTPSTNVPSFRLVQARLFSSLGIPLGPRFWVSERDRQGTATDFAEQPRVAWRDNTAAIIWRTKNSPLTFDQVLSVRLFDLSSGGVTITSIVNDGATVTINWRGGGPLYSVHRRDTITGSETTVATALTGTSHTVNKTGTEAYFRISTP